MNILKEKTKSICPTCSKEIDAKIYEKDEKVFMSKICSEHGNFDVLIEKNVFIYEHLLNNDSLPQGREFNSLVITTTHSNNYNCPTASSQIKNIPDLSLMDIKQAISEFEGYSILVSEGEPPARGNLFDIIRFIRQQSKIPVLVSEGVGLADSNYLRELKKAGLRHVFFPFTGINKTEDTELNGCNLLKIKMRAFKNIKREKLKVSLCVTLGKGVNEKKLKRIIQFCVNNIPYIYELRIKNLVTVSKDQTANSLFLSEILEMLSNILGVEKYEFFNKVINNLDHAPCRLDMDFYSILYIMGVGCKKTNNIKIGKIFLGWKILRRLGFLCFIRLLLADIRRERINFNIAMRHHFDSHNIDLNEISKCTSACLFGKGKKLLPLCLCLILNKNLLLSNCYFYCF